MYLLEQRVLHRLQQVIQLLSVMGCKLMIRDYHCLLYMLHLSDISHHQTSLLLQQVNRLLVRINRLVRVQSLPTSFCMVCERYVLTHLDDHGVPYQFEHLLYLLFQNV